MVRAKTKFKVGASFFALTFFMLVTKNAYFFASYVIAVLLHEFAHDKMAKRLGYATKEIKLSAFGAVLYGDFEGVSFEDEAKIALSGPCTNLCMAICTLAAWWLFPSCYTLTQPFYLANMCIFAINLLPCYPLDGGRVLFALLGKKRGAVQAKKLFLWVGVCLSFFFFALFVFTLLQGVANVTLGLFGIFLFLSCTDMSKQRVYERVLGVQVSKRRLQKGVEIKTVALSQDVEVGCLARYCSKNVLFNLQVVDENMRVVAIYGFDEIEDLLLTYPLDTKLKQID